MQTAYLACRGKMYDQPHFLSKSTYVKSGNNGTKSIEIFQLPRFQFSFRRLIHLETATSLGSLKKPLSRFLIALGVSFWPTNQLVLFFITTTSVGYSDEEQCYQRLIFVLVFLLTIFLSCKLMMNPHIHVIGQDNTSSVPSRHHVRSGGPLPVE
jgi:hypothetical protein